MTITEFLEARIAEDEAAAENLTHIFHGAGTQMYVSEAWISSPLKKERFLAECAAKRAMIDLAGTAGCLDSLQANLDYGYDSLEEEMLRTLASVYADHPDYQEEWAK